MGPRFRNLIPRSRILNRAILGLRSFIRINNNDPKHSSVFLTVNGFFILSIVDDIYGSITTETFYDTVLTLKFKRKKFCEISHYYKTEQWHLNIRTMMLKNFFGKNSYLESLYFTEPSRYKLLRDVVYLFSITDFL